MKNLRPVIGTKFAHSMDEAGGNGRGRGFGFIFGTILAREAECPDPGKTGFVDAW
jgi:hypothetical protein